MTREEAIRTIGDVFARAYANGNEDGHPINLVLALQALDVTLEEMDGVARRASAEYASAAHSHDTRCCLKCDTHTNPHKGCFLR